MPDNRQQTQAETLIGRIFSEAEAEIARIVSDAEARAAGIVEQAHRDARHQMHEAITNLRKTESRETERTTAQIETETRHLRQASDLAAISEGLPYVRDALQQQWRDAASRRRWCLNVLQIACLRLTPEKWKVERPPVWTAEDEEDLSFAILIRTGVRPQVVINDTLRAGIRVHSDAACLDGTLDAMLSDEQQISAMLLNELEKNRSGAAP